MQYLFKDSALKCWFNEGKIYLKWTLSWFVFSQEREAPTHIRHIDPPYINVEEAAEHAAFYAVFYGGLVILHHDGQLID